MAACLRLDRDEVGRLLALHPEYLQSPKAMFAAAREDRADVAAFLLDLGTPIEVEDAKKQRPLHVAAANDAVHVARLLIERGAEIDPYELNYSNTPLDFAVYHEYPRMIDLLRPHSRDVWNLTAIGDRRAAPRNHTGRAAPGEDLLADHSALLAPRGRA